MDLASTSISMSISMSTSMSTRLSTSTSIGMRMSRCEDRTLGAGAQLWTREERGVGLLRARGRGRAGAAKRGGQEDRVEMM